MKKSVILVKRKKPNEIVYARRYPRDYKEYHEGNLDSVHPNKLKTWLRFGKAAIKARDKTFEDVIETVIREMKGKKIAIREKRYLPQEDIDELKFQAFLKGIDPGWVGILFTPEERPKSRKYKEILSYARRT